MQCFLSVMILENKLFMTYENGYNFQKISWGHIKGEGIDLLFCGKTIVNILKFLDVAKREKGGFALNFREHWKRNELRCLPFQSSKSFFFVIILVHVVTQQSLHTTPGSQGMFLLLVVSFTPTWHLELMFRWKRSTYNDFGEKRLSVLKFFANCYSQKWLLQHSELFNGGKKSHTYFNKPAAKSFRFDNPIELLALETPLVNNQC